MFSTVFNKANYQEYWNDSYFTNQSEKITVGFCRKISSDFTVRDYLLPNDEFWEFKCELLKDQPFFRKTSMIEWWIVIEIEEILPENVVLPHLEIKKGNVLVSKKSEEDTSP